MGGAIPRLGLLSQWFGAQLRTGHWVLVAENTVRTPWGYLPLSRHELTVAGPGISAGEYPCSRVDYNLSGAKRKITTEQGRVEEL